MAQDWASVHAFIKGTTPAEELEKLAIRNNMKWELMAMEVGITYQAVLAMCRRHGYKKPKSSEFEFRGKTQTMRQHCKDYGIPESTVSQMKARYKEKGPAWALEKCLVIREWRG